jgi:hypothetical protein
MEKSENENKEVSIFWLTNVALGKPEVQITTQYERVFQSPEVTKVYIQCVEARASAETARQCATLAAWCILWCLLTRGSDSDAENLRNAVLATSLTLILNALFERISFAGSKMRLEKLLLHKK